MAGPELGQEDFRWFHLICSSGAAADRLMVLPLAPPILLASLTVFLERGSA